MDRSHPSLNEFRLGMAIIITTAIVVVVFAGRAWNLPGSEDGRSVIIGSTDFYCPLLNFDKESACYDNLPDILGASDSYSGCALECFTLQTCIFFQWIASNQECQLFIQQHLKKIPATKAFCSSHALANDRMPALQVTPMDKSTCEIPFTWQGTLYYDCITLVKDKKCALYACLTVFGKTKYCTQDGLAVRNTTMVINITCTSCPYRLLDPAPFVNNFIVIFSRNFSSSFDWSSSLEKMYNFSTDNHGNYWYGLSNMERISSGKQLRLRVEVQLASPPNYWVSEGYQWMKVIDSKLYVGPLLYTDSGSPGKLNRLNGSAFVCGCGQIATELTSCWWHKCDSNAGVLTADGDVWTYKSNAVPLQWARMMVKL